MDHGRAVYKGKYDSKLDFRTGHFDFGPEHMRAMANTAMLEDELEHEWYVQTWPADFFHNGVAPVWIQTALHSWSANTVNARKNLIAMGSILLGRTDIFDSAETPLMLRAAMSFLNIVYLKVGEELEARGADRAAIPFYRYLVTMMKRPDAGAGPTDLATALS